MSDRKDFITKEQSKAARGLLNWSQKDLAEKVRIRTASIGDFERGATTPIRKNIEDIISAFEEAGIRFDNNEKEVTVRFLKNHTDIL